MCSEIRPMTFKSEHLGEYDLNTKNNRGQESGDQVGTDNEKNHSSEISLKKTFYRRKGKNHPHFLKHKKARLNDV
jgi:hypothetical protein